MQTPPSERASASVAPPAGSAPSRGGRLRIALVGDWFHPRIGGIERHMTELADRLAADGHDVTVITPMPNARTRSPAIRVEIVPASMLWGVNVAWTPAAFRRLGETLRRGHYDVVHAHGSILSPTAFAALYHAQRAGLPAVCTTHSILGGWLPVFRLLDRFCGWSRWPVLQSAVSERVARELRPLVAPHPVEILANAIEVAEWQLPSSPATDHIAIAAVMRLVPRKRGAALLRALRSAASRLGPGTRVTLRIAGDGPARCHLQALARGMPASVHVEFLGHTTVPDVKRLLARSHFFVLPTRLEAFGLAALEARAAGLPVVAMAESGVGEFIAHGEDGLLARNDAELADHILRLCRDADLRSRITAHNRATPVRCTWTSAIPAHLAAYNRARALAGIS